MTFVQDEISPGLAINHWKRLLDGFKPCHFPAHLDGLPDLRHEFHETTVRLDVGNRAVLELCSQHQLTPRSVFQVAWAIVIGCYAGVEDVGFAYCTSNGGSSDLKTENILICRAQITAENTILDTMVDMMKSFGVASTDRNCSITEIQKTLGLEGQPLFNSGLQIQPWSASDIGQRTQKRDLVKVRVQYSAFLSSLHIKYGANQVI